MKGNCSYGSSYVHSAPQWKLCMLEKAPTCTTEYHEYHESAENKRTDNLSCGWLLLFFALLLLKSLDFGISK